MRIWLPFFDFFDFLIFLIFLIFCRFFVQINSSLSLGAASRLILRHQLKEVSTLVDFDIKNKKKMISKSRHKPPSFHKPQIIGRIKLLTY
jgi:hypothetical protein